MSRSVRSILLSLREDLLQSVCRELFHMQTKHSSREQIVNHLTQSQAITILSALPLY